MTVTLFFLRSLTMRNSFSISVSLREAVGSSMIMTSALLETALAISMICFLATLSVPTRCLGSMLGSRPRSVSIIFLVLSVLFMNPSLVSSAPRVRFSSTVS